MSGESTKTCLRFLTAFASGKFGLALNSSGRGDTGHNTRWGKIFSQGRGEVHKVTIGGRGGKGGNGGVRVETSG